MKLLRLGKSTFMSSPSVNRSTKHVALFAASNVVYDMFPVRHIFMTILRATNSEGCDNNATQQAHPLCQYTFMSMSSERGWFIRSYLWFIIYT